MEWYFVVLLSIAWIAANLAYSYLGKKVGAMEYRKLGWSKIPLLRICLLIGSGALYVSWPVLVMRFNLMPTFFRGWLAISAFCFAALVVTENNFKTEFIADALQEWKWMSKIEALTIPTIQCGILMIISPLVLVLELILEPRIRNE